MEGNELGGLALSIYENEIERQSGSYSLRYKDDLLFSMFGEEVVIPMRNVNILEIIVSYLADHAMKATIANGRYRSKSGIYLYLFRHRREYRIGYFSPSNILMSTEKDSLIDKMKDGSFLDRDCKPFDKNDILDIDEFRKYGNNSIITYDKNGTINSIYRKVCDIINTNSITSEYELNTTSRRDICTTIYDITKTEWIRDTIRKVYSRRLLVDGIYNNSSDHFRVETHPEISHLPRYIGIKPIDVFINRIYVSDSVCDETITSYDHNNDNDDRFMLHRIHHKYNGKFYLSKVLDIRYIEDPNDAGDGQVKKIVVLDYKYGKGHKLERIDKYCKTTNDIEAPALSSKGYVYSKKETIFERKPKFEVGAIPGFIESDIIDTESSKKRVYAQLAYSKGVFQYADVESDEYECSCETNEGTLRYSFNIRQRIYDTHDYTNRRKDGSKKVYLEDYCPVIDINISELIAEESSGTHMDQIFGFVLERINDFVKLMIDRFSCRAGAERVPYYYYGNTLVTKKAYTIFHIGNDFVKYMVYLPSQTGYTSDISLRNCEFCVDEAAIRQVTEDNKIFTSLYFDAQKLKLNYHACNNDSEITNILSTTLDDYACEEDPRSALIKQRKSIQNIIVELFKIKHGFILL